MKAKFIEYDVVRAVRALAENVQTGTSGAVLMVFKSIPPQYEVEFIDESGQSIAVLTVKEEDLELIQHVE